MRALIILFVVGLCLFLLTRFRNATQESFANNMDQVMDLYCETNQQGKDDYKGPWDAVAVPKCESSVCTPETCYTLDQKQFGRRSYYWKPDFAPQMRSNIDTGSVCVTKHDASSNIYCDEKPDEGKCAQNIFNPIPDRQCCVWNSIQRKYVCSDYNHFLNDRGQCEFREVYGDGVTTEATCTSTYPRCDGSYLCPSGKTKYQTYDDNGECIGGTLADCDTCENELIRCDSFNPTTREWTSKKYKQMFGLKDDWSTLRECDYWEVNDMGAQNSYNVKPDICAQNSRPPVSEDTQFCTSLASKQNDAYLRSYVTYNQSYDSTGSNLVWINGSDEKEASYFDQSNLMCHPVCPTGTQQNETYIDPSGFYGSVGVSACAPCPEDQYYNETTSNCEYLNGCTDVRSNMVVPIGMADGRNYYNSNNTCEACGVNGFTASPYATACTNCDSGKEYYDSNVNLTACSDCEGDDKYISTDETDKRVCNTCPSSTDNRRSRIFWNGSNCELECKANAFGGGIYDNDNGSYPNCIEKCGEREYKSTSNTCETCPPGEINPYTNHERSNCEPCPKNEYQNGTYCSSCGRVGRSPGITAEAGASNKTECYITCDKTSSNIYWDGSSYPIQDCGRSPCVGWGGFVMSNIDVPSQESTNARFSSQIKIPKTYSEPAFGMGFCSNNPTSLKDWTCAGSQIDSGTESYCCGLDPTTKEITNGYCQCKQPLESPHTMVYNTRTDKCDIQCSSSNPVHGTYQKRGNNCDVICNSNYYRNGTECLPCPDGGYSAANRSYNRQGIGTCYKNKNTHTDICEGEGQILDASAPPSIYYNQSEYDQSYCRNVCPAGFDVVNTDARHTNITTYQYKLESQTDRDISCPVRYSGLSNVYSINLNTENKTDATSPYQPDSNYYKCQNETDNIKFGNYYSQKRAMCCPPDKEPDFIANRCKYRLNQYVFDSLHSRLHSGVHGYRKSTILSDTDTFTGGIHTTLSPAPDSIPRYVVNTSFNIGDEERITAMHSNLNNIDDEYVYRCEQRDAVINVDPSPTSDRFVCCPESLPLFKNNVCTVPCGTTGDPGITYRGKCFVEANVPDGQYVLESGNYIGKYSDVYGLGLGPQDLQSEKNCTIHVSIANGGTNSIYIDMFGDGSDTHNPLGLGFGTYTKLSTGGTMTYQPTLFVEMKSDGTGQFENNFMFVVSSSGDIWEENTYLYYHQIRSVGGIDYLSFFEFPRYNGQFNTQIPANAQIPMFSIPNYTDYVRENATPCPPASHERDRIGVDETGMVNTKYLWNPAHECKMQCKSSDISVSWNTTTQSYDQCPQKSFSPYWDRGSETPTKKTCVRQPGGVVPDWQDTPVGTCSNPVSMDTVSPDLKVECLVGSFDQSSRDCMRYDTYWVADRTSSTVSYDGDEVSRWFTMDITTKKQIQEKVSASSPSNLDLGSNNIYNCSSGSMQVTGQDICCETANDSVHFHSRQAYCCPSNEVYAHGVGCISSACGSGSILIGFSGSEKCFEKGTTVLPGYYPIKYTNSLYLQTNGSTISAEITTATFVNETGESFFNDGVRTSSINGFNYSLGGFYKDDSSNVVLVFISTDGNKYLINSSGVPIEIPSSKYVNADASQYYLDLSSAGSSCSTINNGNSLKTTTQYYITSTDECEYNCPTSCGRGTTYFGLSNLSPCGFRTDCEEQIVDDDDGVIITVKKTGVPCGTDCCDAQTSGDGTAAVTPNCDAGTYYNGSSCISCPANTWRSSNGQSTSSNDCSPCLDNKISPLGSSNSDACIFDAGGGVATITSNCDAGKYYDGSSCISCPATTYRSSSEPSSSSNDCTSCPLAVPYSSSGSRSSNDCYALSQD